MKRRGLLLGTTLAVLVFCLFPKSEDTFEFDGVNLRLRECSRSRFRLFGIVLWERCSPPQDHPTAVRLRELGVLSPIAEADSQWLLIKGFTSGVRGWIGPGREYVRSLGAYSFGTPVILPLAEDLAQNVWIQWAIKTPAAAQQFWAAFQALVRQKRHGGYNAALYLRAAREYLEQKKLEVTVAELDAQAAQAIDQ